MSSWLDGNLPELKHDNIEKQLKVILGEDEAEEYLNPKIKDTPQNAVDENISRKVAAMGAHALWNSLRTTSNKKLQRCTRSLKDSSHYAYAPNKVTASMKKVNAYRQKVELMHRLANSNESKTARLVNHVKLPKISGDFASGEGPRQYYTDNQLGSNFDNISPKNKSCSGLNKKEFTQPSGETRKFAKVDNKTVSFLSENDCLLKGKFRERMNILGVTSSIGGINNIDLTYTSQKNNKLNPSLHEVQQQYLSQMKPKAESQPEVISKKIKKQSKELPTWQPLTINALADYTKLIPLPGLGNFRNGQAEMWSPTKT